MKKNLRLIIILLVVLGLCIGLYAVMTHIIRDDTGDKTEEPESVQLSNVVDALYIGISRPDIKMEFINDGEHWKYYQDEDFPLDETYIAAVKDAIVNLTASRTIGMTDSTDSLEYYGLDSDYATVTAIDSENNVFAIQIGNPIESGDTFYARKPDENVIYVIPSDLAEAINFNLSDMLEMESFGSFKPKDIINITVQRGDQQYVYTQETHTESVPTGETDEETGSEIYKEVSESTWYDASSGAPIELTDTSAVDAMADAASTFQFTDLKNYKASDTYLSNCGLDDPMLTITVTWSLPTGTEASQTMLIGRLDGAGNYWAKLQTSQAAYTIATTFIDPFIAVTAAA